MMNQRRDHAAVSAHVDFLDIRRLNVVFASKAQHFTHCRMRERTGGKRLDRDARIRERPGFTETVHDRLGIKSPAGSTEPALLRLENFFRCRPTHCSEIGGDNTVFGGMAGRKWLGHRSEVTPKASRLGACNPQRIGDALRIELQQFSACRRSAERSKRTRGMKPGAVMPR